MFSFKYVYILCLPLRSSSVFVWRVCFDQINSLIQADCAGRRGDFKDLSAAVFDSELEKTEETLSRLFE